MSFFTELKRRNVFRVGIAYIVGGWLLVQAADLVLDVIGAPDIVLRSLAALLGLGLIPALIFAWAYEMTPEGLKKESEVDRRQSITQHTGRKLDMVTIGLLIAAIALVVVDRFLPDNAGPETTAPSSSERVAGEGKAATEDVAPDTPAAQKLPTKSVAVLPFANRSNQQDDLFFTDGIHDDLLTQLAKISDLKVISRTSVMEYRDTSKNLRDIGTELGAGSIVEGGVQKVGKRVRINVQLIEAATDRHLWAETYDRELTAENIFDLQSEITREIVQAVAAELTPEEEQFLQERPTQNLAAYEAYLRAREIFYGANYSRDQEAQARPLLEMAVALDPDYVEAISMLAHIYGQEYWRGLDTSAALLATYRATIDRALEINPRSPSALRASANYVYRVENDYRQSQELLEQALQQLPGDADLRADLGLTQRRLGQFEASISNFERALELDPANRFYRSLLVETLQSNRAWERIIANTVSLEDADPDELDIQLNRANAEFSLTGDPAALEQTLQAMNLTNTSTYATLSTKVAWIRRDADAVIAILDNPVWEQAMAVDFPRRSREYQLGRAYRMKGDEARAAEHFEAAIQDTEATLSSSLQPLAYGGMVIALALTELGRLDEALDLATRLTMDIPYERDSLLWGWLLTRQALIRGMSGDRDGALADLEIALRTPTAFPTTEWDIHYDPRWDFMRDDPRFLELTSPSSLIRAIKP